MDYIKSFTEEEFCQLILQAKESLYICLPLLHPKVINAIDELHYIWHGEISINIGLDFNAETFRQGYGEIETYEDMWMVDYNVRQMKDNRISFVIVDSVGYFLFFESRYLLPADKKNMNAVLIDPISIVRLKHHFFSAYKKTELSNHLANAIIAESDHLKNIETEFQSAGVITTSEIDRDTIVSVQESLKRNPPLKPDYKRIVEYYSNKFQYAKLEFKGANLIYRKVDLPKDVLPVMDAELKDKLETKLYLFDKKDEDKCFAPLNAYKVKIVDVRERYFTKIKSREESLISKLHKEEFKKEYEELEKSLQNVKADIINEIATQIDSTKVRLIDDLKDFFIANPQALFPKYPNLWQNKEYVKSEATALSNDLVYNPKKIKWPKAHLLVEEFKLSVLFSDITIEDLKNKEFIEELKGVGLIDHTDIHLLADFGVAIDVNASI